MPDVVMPKLSDSMEQGTILSWLKASGESVSAGEELLEIETDKSTVTHTAESGGVLEILAPEGTSVAVGELIARIGAVVTADEPPAPAERPESETPAEGETPSATAAVAFTEAAARPVTGNGDGNGRSRVAATPLARRVAAVHDVALEEITGTGPLGRITRADVLSHAELDPSAVPAPPASAPAGVAASATTGTGTGTSDGTAAARDIERRQPSRLQQLIARRMTEAKATIPHFQVMTEVAMDRAIALRGELKAIAGEGDAVPSYNDLIIKAAALALREHPLANGSYTDGGFVLHDRINVGMAVAAEQALVVPTVFDAAGRSLGEIARETRRLAARVRSGEISPSELDGGTFTVSNLGMFGMTAITPVINPPQAAILGVGAMRETLARAGGEIVDRSLLTLTLSCDHRILYGADAARFLARIRELLERPLALVL